jgi:hypothetical protein
MKPGDYPLRSNLSRAAARRVLTLRKATQGEGTLIRLVMAAQPPRPDQRCTCPIPAPGTFAVCRCFCETR